MKNHKWEDVSRHKFEKVRKCTRCGIEKYFEGGDMQAWWYIDYTMPLYSTRSTLSRPLCLPDRGTVLGFYRDGSFVYPEALEAPESQIKPIESCKKNS